jgi:hypothetical protein
MVERLTEELRSAERGRYVLAHLLLPHFPYVYERDCSLRPPAEWLFREAAEAPPGMTNSASTRATRYDKYERQLVCTYQKLEGLLNAIPEDIRKDAIIIVHGDHGSRITLRDPKVSTSGALVPSDYRDTYSTLFAIRSPFFDSGVDSSLRPIA